MSPIKDCQLAEWQPWYQISNWRWTDTFLGLSCRTKKRERESASKRPYRWELMCCRHLGKTDWCSEWRGACRCVWCNSRQLCYTDSRAAEVFVGEKQVQAQARMNTSISIPMYCHSKGSVSPEKQTAQSIWRTPLQRGMVVKRDYGGTDYNLSWALSWRESSCFL